ncbi:MAG: hypothetical protein EHM24_33135, partial [Acidobacteria bacterium]
MPATDFVRAPGSLPSGVISMLVEGPAFEPLTLDEAKLRAGLAWAAGDPRDALMEAFVRAARQKVEQDTGLALAEQTRRVVVNVEAGASWPMPAQTVPTQSITPEGATARLQPRFGPAGAWTFTETTSGSYLVVAGWPSIEALQAEAPLLVHAVGLLV